MLKYAREDTHYLLYVVDRIWNELLLRGNENNNLIQAVFEVSDFFIYLFIYYELYLFFFIYLFNYREAKKLVC
jgi:hypothetical protein